MRAQPDFAEGPALRAHSAFGPLRFAGLVLLLLFAAIAQPVRAQGPGSIKVLVAVLPFEVHSARPLAHLETSIADPRRQSRETTQGEGQATTWAAGQCGLKFNIVARPHHDLRRAENERPAALVSSA